MCRATPRAPVVPVPKATHLPCGALLLAGGCGIPGRAQLEAHALDDGARVEAGLQEQLQHEQQQQHVVGLLARNREMSGAPARASQPLRGEGRSLQPREALRAALGPGSPPGGSARVSWCDWMPGTCTSALGFLSHDWELRKSILP